MRPLRLVLAAVAVAALAPVSAAHADPDPLCELYWYEKPSVTVNPEDHTVAVNPGRAGWVC